MTYSILMQSQWNQIWQHEQRIILEMLSCDIRQTQCISPLMECLTAPLNGTLLFFNLGKGTRHCSSRQAIKCSLNLFVSQTHYPRCPLYAISVIFATANKPQSNVLCCTMMFIILKRNELDDGRTNKYIWCFI